MTEITLNELLSLLESYHPAVHCESCLLYKLNYRRPDAPVRCYLTDGCAVFHNEFDHRGTHYIECSLHEIADDCDFLAAYNVCEAMTAVEMMKFPECERQITLCHAGAIPPAFDEFPGTYRFTRIGEAFPPDPHVRPLTRKDSAAVNALCDPAKLPDDTWFGRSEAHTFRNCFRSWEYADGYVKLLGWFEDGRLLGIASYALEDMFNLRCVLRDIFVSPDGRGRGIGKALVRTAVSAAPGKEWLYQSDRENPRSIALAESLGFTLAGAKLEVTL